MILKHYKPYTPSKRFQTTLDFTLLSNVKPAKSLIIKNNRSRGRNIEGKITVRHKGGGHKKRYRCIDFKRNKFNILGKISTIEYDPYRSAYISLVKYYDGDLKYILYPSNLKIGDIICSGNLNYNNIGSTLMLNDILKGIPIHNIEFNPGQGAKIIRAAGTYGIILAKEKDFAVVQLPSGELRLFNKKCLATIGKLGKSEHFLLNLGKAGRKRWLGIRPTVRGSAMNPIDHPHGGGEGKCPIGHSHPMTPWGKPALGVKTRKKNSKSNIFIIKSRKKN